MRCPSLRSIQTDNITHICNTIFVYDVSFLHCKYYILHKYELEYRVGERNYNKFVFSSWTVKVWSSWDLSLGESLYVRCPHRGAYEETTQHILFNILMCDVLLLFSWFLYFILRQYVAIAQRVSGSTRWWNIEYFALNYYSIIER